jgi:hypothetical protein
LNIYFQYYCCCSDFDSYNDNMFRYINKNQKSRKILAFARPNHDLGSTHEETQPIKKSVILSSFKVQQAWEGSFLARFLKACLHSKSCKK